METTVKKDDSNYVINFIVKKINVIYSGLDKFPFCCDVLAEDNAYFRCAVSLDNIAIFLLSERGDELFVSMHPEYKNSSVMAVDTCINTSQSWHDLAWHTRYHNDFAARIVAHINVKQVWMIPMPFFLNGIDVIMQDFYYCLILGMQNNQYIECTSEGKHIAPLVTAQNADQLELTLDRIDEDERWTLNAVKNLSLSIKNIYPELQKL